MKVHFGSTTKKLMQTLSNIYVCLLRIPSKTKTMQSTPVKIMAQVSRDTLKSDFQEHSRSRFLGAYPHSTTCRFCGAE